MESIFWEFLKAASWQTIFFCNRLDQLIDLRHPLAVLASLLAAACRYQHLDRGINLSQPVSLKPGAIHLPCMTHSVC
jgi:hypothetical protein